MLLPKKEQFEIKKEGLKSANTANIDDTKEMIFEECDAIPDEKDQNQVKSVPAENHFLLSPVLQDHKNKDKIKEMMERGDDDFGNDI